MSDNKHIRQLMEKKYGKICMIEAAGIRYIPIEQRREIKGYRKTQEQITYHHIKEKSKGGLRTEENGALIKEYNHAWLHSLPEDEKKKINEQLKQYKLNFSTISIGDNLEVEGQQFTFDLSSDTIELNLEPITPEIQEKRKKFNRAKEKRKTQKLIDDAYYDLEI